MTLLTMSSFMGHPIGELSDFDLTYPIALLVFGLLSGLGNWAKKRATRAEGDAERTHELDDIAPRADRPQDHAIPELPPMAKPARRPRLREADQPPAPPVIPVAQPPRAMSRPQARPRKLVEQVPRPGPRRRPARSQKTPSPQALSTPAPEPTGKPAHGPPLGSVQVRLGVDSLTTLRRAIVMAEILGPPVALRNQTHSLTSLRSDEL